MAGDWIKMRGSLTTHPKVLQLAKIIATDTEVGRRLSTGFNGALDEIVTRDVTRDVTIASLLRVWCACNEHTSDGVWRGIEIDDLDQIAGVPGFGAAMAQVGWAIPDQENGTIAFPNFLEYNAPAKNGGRSSAAERQRRYRQRKQEKASQEQSDTATGDGNSDITGDATRDVTSVTREEKRRDIKNNPPISPPTRKPAKRATQLPDDFEPNDTNRRVAAEEGVSIHDHLPQFRDHHRAKGSTMKDWHAALNTWLRNAKKFGGGGRSSPGRHPTQPSTDYRAGVTSDGRLR
ncbi:Primosomal protein I [Alloalcanivorax xenomutans]|uniref:hypothetical protein n=1 Tax=Alloalcanivorax xenomutans TaxID=1094342 RepID=UPI0006D5BC8E|nr:hypothetical protein [Alloalcanivorax xenomutans]CUR48467.1 Primosomal protein I [Alloalcanivorax xenomutans]